jgi:competence protein ComFC
MWLIDWLFPKNCVGCNSEGGWLCAPCLAALPPPKPIGCADCGVVTLDGRYCLDHAKDHKLTGLVVVQPFHKGTLREAIHNLKYNGIRELALPLGQLLEERLGSYPELDESLVIPIPLHSSREQKRGFNQAVLLADQLHSRKRLDTVLLRRKTIATQASLSHEERRTSLKKVFYLNRKLSQQLRDQTILLVDDVATTTTTLDEAAAVLIEGGAKEIWGAVIAKG